MSTSIISPRALAHEGDPLGDYQRLKTFVDEIAALDSDHEKLIQQHAERRAQALANMVDAAAWMGVRVESVPRFNCRVYGPNAVYDHETIFHLTRCLTEYDNHTEIRGHIASDDCRRCDRVGKMTRGRGQRHGRGIQHTPLGSFRLLAEVPDAGRLSSTFLFVAVTR